MKFLCDVHISLGLVNSLRTLGYSTMHVNELPEKWYTPDSEICAFADADNFVVVTKDKDFKDSFFIKKTPKKLILIRLGNITNELLISIFEKNIHKISRLSSLSSFMLEIDKVGLRLTEA